MGRVGLETGGRWAARTEFGEESHALARAIALREREGREVLDLTVSNPTRCGFAYDAEAILQPLAAAENLWYDADPLGMRSARESVSEDYYGSRGVSVDPDSILLTTSTSEAYGYLLRLLCNAGDEILVPSPSYPLFDLLARMHDVRLVAYPLRWHDDWRIDFGALEERIGPRTRAVVVVHPNNPTGHGVAEDERERLEAIARKHGLPLIADEVFLDYPVEAAAYLGSFSGGETSVLTFVLSGLSKVLALPQMKLAWTVVCGPEARCEEALRRLAFIADTFLSLQAPVQHALRDWLPLGAGMQAQVRARLRGNLAALDAEVGSSLLVRRAPVRAGWSVLLRVPATEGDEELALRLVEGPGVVTHPGSFYGLGNAGWLVLSLLVPGDVFAEGVSKLVHAVDDLVNRESPLQTGVGSSFSAG